MDLTGLGPSTQAAVFKGSSSLLTQMEGYNIITKKTVIHPNLYQYQIINFMRITKQLISHLSIQPDQLIYSMLCADK